jgi:hypothetical protein
MRRPINWIAVSIAILFFLVRNGKVWPSSWFAPSQVQDPF